MPIGNGVVPVGQLFAGVSPAADSVVQLVAPGSNLNGIILRTATVAVNSGGTFLFADTSAPASATDFTKRVVLQISSTVGESATLPNPLFLFAGMGVWVSTNSDGADAFITYDLVVPDQRG